jgi:A/G-specific adenine glycosylase
MSFSNEIIGWYSANKRQLPWRGTFDAYRIWLSEIILQQTRVAQGLPYYQKFVDKYPDITALAAAPEDEILKLWQGLGYYSRARNMHAAAKMVANQYNGNFPSTYKEILTLKGIGKYTAAAIASIAFNEPVAVVDGNVYRVLARYYGIDEPIDGTQGQKLFFELANELIDATQPANYNQAVMEFGALYCKPQNPDCGNCIFAQTCKAYKDGTVAQLPVKAKKTKVKERYFNYLYFDKPGAAFLQKRAEKDIWANLYEFPLIETEEPIKTKANLLQQADFKKLVGSHSIQFIKPAFSTVHKLSHRNIHGVFWHIGVDAVFLINNSIIFEVNIDTLHSYGVSRLTERFISEYLDKTVLTTKNSK